MGEELRLCEECGIEELEFAQAKNCPKCRPAVQRRRMRLYKKKERPKKNEKETFPTWTCDNGHINKLKFNPKMHPGLYNKYICIEKGCDDKPVKI